MINAMCQWAAYLDQRTDVLILNGTLAGDLVKPTPIGTISHTLVLEITLTTLVANRAIERVVREEKLHHTLPGLVNERGTSLDHHSRLDRPGARRNRLGHPLDLDQTHSAVTSNHQLFVVTVSGDGHTRFLASLDEGGPGYKNGFASVSCVR